MGRIREREWTPDWAFELGRQCARKQRYDDKVAALEHAHWVRTEHGGLRRVYRCPAAEPPHFHLTSRGRERLCRKCHQRYLATMHHDRTCQWCRHLNQRWWLTLSAAEQEQVRRGELRPEPVP